jgi:hypothetical protein
VVGEAEEPRARRWTAGMAAVAINGRGLGGRPFPGRGRGAGGLRRRGGVPCALGGRGSGAGRRGGAAQGRWPARQGWWAARLRLKEALTGGPHLSVA